MDPKDISAIIDELESTPEGRAWIRKFMRDTDPGRAGADGRPMSEGLGADQREDPGLSLLRRLQPPSAAKH